jgi:hypothetical protein
MITSPTPPAGTTERHDQPPAEVNGQAAPTAPSGGTPLTPDLVWSDDQGQKGLLAEHTGKHVAIVNKTGRAARRRGWGRGALNRAVARAFPAVAFVAAGLAATALAIGVGRGAENDVRPAVKPGVAVADQDEARLWRAGTSGDYFHNQVLVLAEAWRQHADLVTKYADAADERRARFAKTIIARDAVNEELRTLAAAEQKLQGELPAALERTKANAILKGLIGREPAWRVMDVQGGIVAGIDELRKTKLAVSRTATYHHLINTRIADQVEAHYRKALGDKKLPEDVGLHFREPFHGRARIVYAGAKPLTNVVVVTRTAMRPAGAQAEATRRIIDLINEAADPGADANKVAAQLMQASKVLHETAQAVVVYIPLLEPGDELEVDLYEQGFYWDALEAKVSLYTDAGMLLDKVLFAGGPHNDLSISAQERQRLTKPPPKAKPLGPVFNQLARTEIVLKADAAGPFERCAPVDMTFLPVGVKDAVEAGKPLAVIARSADAYVAVGPKKQTGHALVLVPRTAVAKLNDLSKKKAERRKVEPVKKPTWLLLKPPADGSTDYRFATAHALVENICTTVGGRAGLGVGPDELVRALAVGADDYVVVLPKPLKDGSILILVPKSVVKEVKDKP